jgi:adenylyltransferase/sulfurtransferase
VARRVDVDETAEPVAMSPAVLHELFSHARDAFPEECCGLVFGDARGRFARAVRCRNEMTRMHHAEPLRYPRDNRVAFWMNEGDIQRAERQAQAGEPITAVYHSHVNVDAYLSDTDLAYAESAEFPFPQAAQIVIAVWESRVRRSAIFERAGAGEPFRGRPLVAAAP